MRQMVLEKCSSLGRTSRVLPSKDFENSGSFQRRSCVSAELKYFMRHAIFARTARPATDTPSVESYRSLWRGWPFTFTVYRCVSPKPKATLAECRAYLFNLNPTKDPYSNSQLHCADELLGLTRRKTTPTTADLTSTPDNLRLRRKRELYLDDAPTSWNDRGSHCRYHCYGRGSRQV